jgi:hypothetical protein
MTTPAPPRWIPGEWEPKWVEEFNAGLGPKFSSGVPWEPWIGKPVCPPESMTEIACYDEACATVADSILTLSAISKVQTVGGVPYAAATGWVSSCLSGLTVGHGELLGARVWLPFLPSGCGVWLTQLNNEPANGEDDVVETWDGRPTATFHSSEGKPTQSVPGNWGGRWFEAWTLHSTDGNCYRWYDRFELAPQSMGGVTDELFVVLSMTLDPSVNPAPILVPAAMKCDWLRAYRPKG